MSRKRYIETSTSPYPEERERILLALRAGPLSRDQLIDRLGIVKPYPLIHEGLVEESKDKESIYYRLTPAGRAACPRWRDLCKPRYRHKKGEA